MVHEYRLNHCSHVLWFDSNHIRGMCHGLARNYNYARSNVVTMITLSVTVNRCTGHRVASAIVYFVPCCELLDCIECSFRTIHGAWSPMFHCACADRHPLLHGVQQKP